LASSEDDMGNSSDGSTSFPEGTVHCDPGKPIEVVEVTNPVTSKTWMDRNLGTSKVAIRIIKAMTY